MEAVQLTLASSAALSARRGGQQLEWARWNPRRCRRGTHCAAPARRPPPVEARSGGGGGGEEARSSSGGGGYTPFPFSQADYVQVGLQLVQGNMSGMAQGFLLLMREEEDQDKGLVVAVGGDTLAGIAMEAQGQSGQRPLALDLLWKVLTRGREISKRHWTLVRVAIVAMRGSTYLGRLWFGSGPEEILWDCDARPSDSIWLSLKSGCPIYVHRDVWEQHATPLKDLQAAGGSEDRDLDRLGQGEGEDARDPMAIRATDPEVVKRMKGELRVAVAEEDYATAARLRDHPILSLYMRRRKAQDSGDLEAAKALNKQLHEAIQAFEAGQQ